MPGEAQAVMVRIIIANMISAAFNGYSFVYQIAEHINYNPQW
jgi:hypothetical protein